MGAAKPSVAIEIGDTTRQLMQERGWNVGELAMRSGLEPEHVKAIVAGRNRPLGDALMRLALALQVEPKELAPAHHAAFAEEIAERAAFSERYGRPSTLSLLREPAASSDAQVGAIQEKASHRSSTSSRAVATSTRRAASTGAASSEPAKKVPVASKKASGARDVRPSRLVTQLAARASSEAVVREVA